MTQGDGSKPDEQAGKTPESNSGTDNNAGDSGESKETGSKLDSGLKEEIRAFVREITGQANPKGKPADTGKAGDPGEPNSYARRIERQAEEAVQAAAARIFKEKEHEQQHKNLAKAVEGQPQEKPKVPLLRRVLWGEE